MSIVYFTNAASVGAGSVVDAIQRASDGDVVAPDPNAFPLGERIDVQLTSTLDLTKSLSFDGRARRVRLIASTYTCVTASERSGCADLTAIDFEFVGSVRKEGGTARYVRCAFYGAAYSSNLAIFTEGAVGMLEDCVVAGSRVAGVRSISSRVTVLRSTLAGNVGGDLSQNAAAYAPICVDSIANAVPSTVGFVDGPPDALDYPEGRLPWETWNLHLTPSSPYASGATDATPCCDFDGLKRGRTDGTRAIGAYEVGEYDFIWRGVDAEGSAIASPSFGAADGWFDASGAVATSAPRGRLYVGQTTAFADAPPSGSSLTAFGGAKVVAVGVWEGEALTLGIGSSAEFDAARLETSTLGERSSASFGEGRTTRLTLEEGATIYLTGEAPSFLFGEGDVSNAYFRTLGATSGRVRHWDRVDLSTIVFDNTTHEVASASASSFCATSRSPRVVEFEWEVADPTIPIALERLEPNGEWRVVASGLLSSPTTLGVARSGRVTWRLYDGGGYLSDASWTYSGAQFSAIAIAVGAERTEQNWEAICQMATTSENVMIGQGITILARIYDAFDASVALLNDGSNVTSVSYTCYYNSNGLFAETNAAVEGHENVAVGTETVLEALQTSDAWTRDDVGYNFVLTPDVREYPLFRQEGRFQIKVEIRVAQGNPIVFYVPVTVVART